MKVLGTEDLLRNVLNEDNNGTLVAVETIPESEGDGDGECLHGGDVFHGTELFELPNDEIVVNDLSLVLSVKTLIHQPAFI